MLTHGCSSGVLVLLLGLHVDETVRSTGPLLRELLLPEVLDLRAQLGQVVVRESRRGVEPGQVIGGDLERTFQLPAWTSRAGVDARSTAGGWRPPWTHFDRPLW